MISLDSLREAVEGDEFFLEYMPTISLADGRCTGAEALIRWRRPSGVLQPLEFIPQADNTPVSGLITYWVIDTVAAELGGWLAANLDAHIAINVPPEILGRGGVEYAASKSGLIASLSQIIVEITERGLPDLIGVEAINQSRERGIRIALDDATLDGPANLAVLARANFDIIKLDRTLIAELDPQGPAPQWLDDISAMVQSTQLMVIAEGVETEYQRLTLHDAYVQQAQGFYFSRPLPVADFVSYYGRAS